MQNNQTQYTIYLNQDVDGDGDGDFGFRFGGEDFTFDAPDAAFTAITTIHTSAWELAAESAPTTGAARVVLAYAYPAALIIEAINYGRDESPLPKAIGGLTGLIAGLPLGFKVGGIVTAKATAVLLPNPAAFAAGFCRHGYTE